MAFIEGIADPQLDSVFRYWRDRWKPGRLPRRDEIDPVKLPPDCLPHLFLYRLEPDGRLRYILIGTAIVKVLGRDFTGHYLDEVLTGPAGARRQRLYRRVIEGRMPLYVTGPAFTPSGESRSVERLILPVSSDGEVCDYLFGIARYGEVLIDMMDEPWLEANGEPGTVLVATEDDLRDAGRAPGDATR